MTLADVPPSSSCRVVQAAPEAADLQSRLYALGIFPGVTVSVLRVAPLGDPIQVKVGTSLLSIRHQDAALVEVEEDDS